MQTRHSTVCVAAAATGFTGRACLALGEGKKGEVCGVLKPPCACLYLLLALQLQEADLNDCMRAFFAASRICAGPVSHKRNLHLCFNSCSLRAALIDAHIQSLVAGAESLRACPGDSDSCPFLVCPLSCLKASLPCHRHYTADQQPRRSAPSPLL